jgi:hypothetical protein
VFQFFLYPLWFYNIEKIMNNRKYSKIGVLYY